MLDLNRLKTEGVVVIDGVHSKDELISLAKSIGKIRPHPNGEYVATLKSSDGRSSLAGTFSNIYGLAAFPFHTDTAFWELPARYIVMGVQKRSRCKTNYISLSDIEKNISGDFLAKARKSIYLSETFEGSKYTSLVFGGNEAWGFRFDPNTMTPANAHAKKFHEELEAAIDRVEPREIDWSGHKAVVFDNWKFLHGRESVKNESREMLRIYLEN